MEGTSLSQVIRDSTIESGQGADGARGGDIASHNTINIENSYRFIIVTQSPTDHGIKEQSLKDVMAEVNAFLEEKKADADTSDEPHIEPSPDANPLIKVLTIYTGVDQAMKKLKKSTDLVLTLTPEASDPQHPWAPIIWKVLHFEKLSTLKIQVNWSTETGFCVLQEEEDGTLTPGALRMPAKPGHTVILREVEEEGHAGAQGHTELYLDSEFRIKDSTQDIAIANTTNTSQRLALCTIDPKKPESDRFSPVVDVSLFGESDDESGRFVLRCGPPVLLRAYALTGCKERQPSQIDTTKVSPIFTKNLNTLSVCLAKPFRLYSKPSGHIVLE